MTNGVGNRSLGTGVIVGEAVVGHAEIAHDILSLTYPCVLSFKRLGKPDGDLQRALAFWGHRMPDGKSRIFAKFSAEIRLTVSRALCNMVLTNKKVRRNAVR